MAEMMISLTTQADIEAGTLFLLAPGSGLAAAGVLAVAEGPFDLRAGDSLMREGKALFQGHGDSGRGLEDRELKEAFLVHGVRWTPSGGNAPAQRCVLLESRLALSAGAVLSLSVQRSGYAVAWVTMSDKGSRGQREDTAGPLAAGLVADKLDVNLSCGFILPDEEPGLRALLTDLALVQGFDLIVTSGGTGVAPRDITPEATLAVIEKRLPGIERAMTAASLEKTPHAVISRAVAGTLGGSLIINLPGSPKAVRECLEPLLPALGHTLKKLQGDPADCGGS